MRKILFILYLLLCASPVFSKEMNVGALRQIIQAGGSVILDMEKNVYTAAELITLARALKYNATLTIRIGNNSRLSVPECIHIANSNPGHVVFWLK